MVMLYQTQEKCAQAEPLYRRVLEVYERVLEANHPSTQIVRDNYTALQCKLETDETPL